MDKFKAAFEVLYLLAVIDRELHDREIDVINNFVHDNFGKGNYDTRATAKSLNAMTHEGRLQELGYVAKFLNSVCTAQDKLNILDFALRVIVADKRITDTEAAAYVVVGNIWNIDVTRFTNERLK